MSKLNTTVHVLDETDGAYVVYGVEDEVPEWAAAKMGAHVFEDGKHPFPNGDYPGKGEKPTGARTTTRKASDK